MSYIEPNGADNSDIFQNLFDHASGHDSEFAPNTNQG